MDTGHFTFEETLTIGQRIGIKWELGDVDVEQFRMGLGVELDHGPQGGDAEVTQDDEDLTGRIALAHLREAPDYYTRLADMDREAQA